MHLYSFLSTSHIYYLENYCVLMKYHKCVLSLLIFDGGATCSLGVLKLKKKIIYNN